MCNETLCGGVAFALVVKEAGEVWPNLIRSNCF